MSRWFRHYAGMMRDEKLVRVALRAKQPIERVVWVWGAILESAAEVNDAGRYELDVAEVARFLRTKEAHVTRILECLLELGRLSPSGVVKWGERQFLSDSSTARVRRHRQQREGNSDPAIGNGDPDGCSGTGNGDVTPDETFHETGMKRFGNAPETETETETETEKKKGVAANAAPRRKSNGSTLPNDWLPTDADREYGLRLGLSEPQIDAAFEEMRLWATGNSNRAVARKADWNSTFRAWMRRNSQKATTNGPVENLSAVARRIAQQGISFGPKPSLARSGDTTNGPPVRLLSESRGE